MQLWQPDVLEVIPTELASRNISDGTATRYGLDGPGIESRWGGARSPEPVQIHQHVPGHSRG
jgi:hypothetical protein